MLLQDASSPESQRISSSRRFLGSLEPVMVPSWLREGCSELVVGWTESFDYKARAVLDEG
ncbi:hypothetical protein M407DRAFT_245267 [Tulasnella calospora MUT 4182]|uniref:Uncharacterized protein n=1 Tax=Tulasnella calospora MUT 4182 TaxID=1051891 RepID=A0A0C3QC68_9AGAM|nr:hypothetical protein M407DRAFT_245267 [Tulasnella calospora MUT 4182]